PKKLESQGYTTADSLALVHALLSPLPISPTHFSKQVLETGVGFLYISVYINTMGAVCSAGTVKKSRKPTDSEQEKSSGFSGKLKSIGSFGRHKKSDDPYTYTDEIDVFRKENLYDSGELHLSISRELKASTPMRTPANKVGSK
ncbi:electron transport complex protein RnfA, partial [Striga asiatica]